MLHIDLHPPGKAGGLAEQFLIPPVAETTNRLGQRDGRDDRIEARRQPPTAAVGNNKADCDTKRNATGNTKTALPNFECVDPTPLVRTPIGGNVIEPCANEPCRHRPKRNDIEIVGIAATRAPAFTTKFDRSEDAKSDHQPVHVERTELVRGRTRD